ncbi:hypothetical protein ABZ816_29530 [Actinosynnema sp. NPDC047251]|uniref:Uncharacterized protein n=1 Tax=Saccharothrix espanaensis (strain ATCC 51144 / DSM 44229 / JCM 9112 / NBRC 15066 / NRRL 15764) TaxID=1179773 RepID=K0KDB0_SACES|nr:hypothetical protein [Saccharothrix espanaensis]CCH34779.1 hypothetical protein BN6_75540 [Saccharothrix espanaensis DSM 44229]
MPDSPSDFEVGATINQQPRPRILIYGFGNSEGENNDEPLPEFIRPIFTLAPTVVRVTSLSQVRTTEWDVLVTDQPLFHKISNGFGSTTYKPISPHLCVLYITNTFSDQDTIEQRPDWRQKILFRQGHVSQEFTRIRNLPAPIAELVHEQLEPVFKRRVSHQKFEAAQSIWASGPDFTSPSRSRKEYHEVVIQPFSITPSGAILAGRYARSESSETWLLPSDTPDLSQWFSAALTEWQKLAPERFPALPDWTTRQEWSTAAERYLRKQVDDLKLRRASILRQLEAEEGQLKKSLLAAKEAADAYERALLTEQDDPLKRAVAKALSDLGFAVTDSDATAASDDHLEDLQVRDSRDPNWIALVEVKGYGRGAKTEALTQFIRFTTRFMHAQKRTPDALWYIVNQFRGKDPSARQQALHGKAVDVAAFGSGGGLVIDTVELFRLVISVQEGVISRDQAREALRKATGRFLTGFPAPEDRP